MDRRYLKTEKDPFPEGEFESNFSFIAETLRERDLFCLIKR